MLLITIVEPFVYVPVQNRVRSLKTTKTVWRAYLQEVSKGHNLRYMNFPTYKIFEISISSYNCE